jgi:uncharacterized protein (DUF58 family)
LFVQGASFGRDGRREDVDWAVTKAAAILLAAAERRHPSTGSSLGRGDFTEALIRKAGNGGGPSS